MVVQLLQTGLRPVTFSVPPLLLLVLAFVVLQAVRRLFPAKQHEKVYVLDFSVHQPDKSWAFSRSKVRELCEKRELFTPEDIDFQQKIAYRTGLGDETAVCPAIQSGDPKQLGIEAARFEFGATCFTTIADLLQKTGVSPQQQFAGIGWDAVCATRQVAVLGCSLGGMGCSAGVIALDLARELLELHPNKIALVVSHENITNNYYCGNDRSMLIPNCLFRSNGSAVLLSNKAGHARRAKYSIKHVVRTNLAANDVAYNCVMQTEDAEGKLGVRLNKDLIKVGADALKQNMTALGPLVLPWSEQLKFAGNMALRSAAKRSKALAGALPAGWLRPYIPDFTQAFDFFCIHTGGRGIIDGLEAQMQLSRQQVEPSRASLYRFGNTSSTSIWYELAYIESTAGLSLPPLLLLFLIWYELAYIESTAGLSRGQRVWQLAFGSGFKFNSAVLVANRRIADQHAAWQGFDSVAMWAELDELDKAISRRGSTAAS
ncbi:hypothetical protein OEZ86_001137 [Tetradesmus obliquus]|nr:hypothetical protein OEZ86_001137 [Tetradesmus obliquus]